MYGSLGLGTFPFANPFTPVTKERAYEVLETYFERGGTYVDTAPTYAFGEVERLLGEYFQGKPRSSFAISTSCGYVREGDSYRVSGKRDDVRRDAEESLSRLGLTHFDIYISHIPDLDTPLEETAAALQELLDEGIAQRIGVSNVDAAQLARYLTGGAITVVQNRYSYLNRSIDPELLKLVEEHELEVVAYQVIERGLLTARGPRMNVNEADLRAKKPEFSPERMSLLREFVEGTLIPIADGVGDLLENVVIRWCVGQPGVGLAQVGATGPDQVRTFPINAEPLPSSRLREMEAAFDRLSAELRSQGFPSVRAFMGLVDYDVRSGSATGQ